MKKVSIEDFNSFRFATTLACNFNTYPGKSLICTVMIEGFTSKTLYQVKSYKGETVTLELETPTLIESIDKYNSL